MQKNEYIAFKTIKNILCKMAKKAGSSTQPLRFEKPKKKRKGVHAKTRNSVHKKGKNYNKPYRGQGRK